MRQGQPSHSHNKNRMRNRNRKGPNPLTRSYESNGGDVKIRGTALHVAEKYVQLARDAQASSDRVAAENYLQHAEHYYRIVAAAQAQMPQPQQQPIYRNTDGDDDGDDAGSSSGGGYQGNGGANPNGATHGGRPPQQAFAPPAEQPYINGNQPNGQDRADGEAGVQEQPVESRSDDAQGRQQGHPGGGHRRRRRPYRDNFSNNDRGDQPATETADPFEAGGDPPGDD